MNCSFLHHLISVICLYVNVSRFSSSTEPPGQLIQTISLGIQGIQLSLNEMQGLSPRGDNGHIVKIHWPHLLILFSRTIKPISTKLGTKYPWGRGIQVCSNEWSCPFTRGITMRLFNIAFLRWSMWHMGLFFNIQYVSCSVYYWYQAWMIHVH